MGGGHLVLLAHTVVVVAKDEPSGHEAEDAAVCQTRSPPHTGEAAAGVVTGEARHGELLAGIHIHIVELISLSS